MRLGSGTFAACCVLIEVLGVALFLRGFFPTPVFSGAERQAESPAPEPSAGTTAPPHPERLCSRGSRGGLFRSDPNLLGSPSCRSSLLFYIQQLCGQHHYLPH